MPDCGIIFLIFICSPFEASLQTPDRSLFMFCGISGGLPPFSLFTYPLCQFYLLCIKELIMLHPCMHLLYLTSKLSCEYFQSTHLACWFGQMLMKAISWMKSLIASPTPRGVPVSPVRSCFSHCIIRFRNPEINSSSLTSTLDELPVRSQVIHHHFLSRASSMSPHPCAITALK